MAIAASIFEESEDSSILAVKSTDRTLSVEVGYACLVETRRKQIKMKNHIVEVVSFKLNDGVSETDFLKTIPPTSKFIMSLDGFISRRLSCDDSGTWLEHVEWENMDKAKAASDAFMKEEGLMPMMQAIDEKSIKMAHNRLMVSLG